MPRFRGWNWGDLFILEDQEMLTEHALVIQLNQSDDVVIACREIPAGTLLDHGFAGGKNTRSGNEAR
jgi:hypothetical protein